MPSSCFGHSCGHPHGGALQGMDVNQCTDLKYEVLKGRVLQDTLKYKIQINIFVINSGV
jgi:hypothetical protein